MEEKIKEPEQEEETNPEVNIFFCECRGTTNCGFEPGPNGRLICSACGGYVT